MKPIWAALAGALVGFALVFLGPLGMVLGAVATGAWVLVATARRDATGLGVAAAAGGAVVAAISGRTVVTAFGDPNLYYEPQAIALMIGGAIVAGVAVLSTLVAWDRRNRRSPDRDLPKTQ